MIKQSTELVVYLLGEIGRQTHHEDIAKFVSSTQGVIVKLQLCSKVAGGGVISVDVQLVLSLLVLHEEDRLLRVGYIDPVSHDCETGYMGWKPANAQPTCLLGLIQSNIMGRFITLQWLFSGNKGKSPATGRMQQLGATHQRCV